jgi:hypothetical protein
MISKKATTTAIPTRREVDAEFAEQCDQLAALREDQRVDRAEARQLAVKQDAERSTAVGRDGDRSTPSAPKTARQERAERLLTGEPSVDVQTDQARLSALIERIGDRDAAIDLLGAKIAVSGRRASHKIVEQVAGQHKALVADFCAKLIELHEANKSYHRLVDTLNDDGVAWTALHPMQSLHIAGQPSDRYGNVALYLREAVAHGFIDASVVPPELRESR